MLRTAIVICGILLGMLLAAIFWASGHNFWHSLRYMLADPWATVALLDLGVGLLFVAVWISMVEPRPVHAAVWIVALFVLGNMVTLAYLLWRTRSAKRLADLFLPPRSGDRGG